MKVQVINLSNNKLPQYETPMSAGMDVRADFSRVTVDNPIKAFGDCEILFKSNTLFFFINDHLYKSLISILYKDNISRAQKQPYRAMSKYRRFSHFR